jgi:hypothetical protein
MNTIDVMKEALRLLSIYGSENGERPTEVIRAMQALRDEIRAAEAAVRLMFPK